MVKRFGATVLLGWQCVAVGASCPMLPTDDASMPLNERLSASLAELQSACAPKRGSTLEQKLSQIQQDTALLGQQKSTVQRLDQMAIDFKTVITDLNQSCTGDSDRAKESAQRAAAALATTLAETEPVPEAAGLGVALSGSILNSAMELLLDKAPRPRDASCLLLDTVERDLQCTQHPATTSPERALFDVSTGKSNSVDAVLTAMQRVEERAKMDEHPASESNRLATNLFSNPLLNDLFAVMEIRQPNVSQDDATSMPDYLKQVAQDLRFAAAAWSKGGPSAARVQEYLGADRMHLLNSFTRAIARMSEDQSRSSEALGNGIDDLVKEFQAYSSTLKSGEAGEIEQKKNSVLRTLARLARIAPRNAENEESASGLIRQAIDRHFQLQFPPESGLRKLRNFELAREMDASLQQAVSAKPDSLMSEAYPLLRDAYGDSLKKQVAQHKARMTEALRTRDKNPKLFSTDQTAALFTSSVQPLLERCMLLAHIYIFATDTNSLSPSGIEEYQQICSPFLCDEILGSFPFEGGAAPVRAKQCKLIQDQNEISEKLRKNFMAPPTLGKLCANKVAPSTFQKLRRFLRPPPTSTHDDKSTKR
jgi:hypothetical protein